VIAGAPPALGYPRRPYPGGSAAKLLQHNYLLLTMRITIDAGARRTMVLLDSLIQNAANEIMPWIVGVLMATAIFFSIRLRFVQVRRFRDALRETVRSRQTAKSGALAPLQAFLTSLAATIGVGNIVGVATAIVSGGPGALFWIWCYGFFAMATKFAEAALGLHFRVAHGESALAGPMYYLRDGLKSPALASIFAFTAGVGCLFTTPLTQPNSVANVLDTQLEKIQLSMGSWQIFGTQIQLNTLVIGCVIAVLTWLVIVGGIKAIGRAAEKLSPLKVTLYVIGGLVVIAMHAERLPDVLALVFREAFSTQAVAGATGGWVMMNAIRYGVARGVYANEAGYGTAAVVYGIAKSSRPEQQGLAAAMEVFIISFVTSSISALAILVTGTWNSGGDGPTAISHAFDNSMPVGGGWMLAVSVFLFGYSALIGWAYYGETFFEYLFGPRIIAPYRWMYCLLIPFGAIAKVDLVWAWGDILNAIQIIPNVIGIIGLSGLAAKYANSRAARDDAQFNQ
jgi:alanine or glycine:cation symporter, AGCS family